MANRTAYIVGQAAGAVARALPGLTRDIAGLGGAGLVAYGAWLVYAPAGYIAGGIILLAGAFLSVRAEAAAERLLIERDR